MNITGSAINDEYMNSYKKPLAPFYDSLDNYYEILDSLDKSFDERLPSAFEGICDHINIANKKIDSVKKTFIHGHPSSFISLWILYNDISYLQNLEFVVDCFQYLDDHLQNSSLGKFMVQRIKMETVFLNGKKFPSIPIADSSGKAVKLQNIIKAKYTLIDFWFSHCGPCIAQFPLMRNLYARYKDVGFDIIGISIDKSADKKDWLKAIAKHELNWKQFWDIDGKEAEKYFIDSYPTNFLLDSEEKIIRKNILPEELEILIKNSPK
jgi:thiol-disulfide isomerase/thioredoxin